ncbi:MAG: zf-TFIIB domain-containing protein [Acidobacteriota bacterium]
MFCSGCGSGLTPSHYFNIPVDACGTCGGVWLEEGRLKWIIEIGPRSIPTARLQAITRYQVSSRPGFALRASDARRIVKCPYCVGILRPVNYSATSGVAVYKCTQDHGVWIPKGGIDRLVAFIGAWDRFLKKQGPYYASLAQMERKRFLRKLSR